MKIKLTYYYPVYASCIIILVKIRQFNLLLFMRRFAILPLLPVTLKVMMFGSLTMTMVSIFILLKINYLKVFALHNIVFN